MKSRTSFFNFTVFKKDITRFFPVWGLYSIILVLYYVIDSPYYLGESGGGLRIANKVELVMGWVNVVYAGVCAMMLFGDLYKSRLCNALHAMPVRREGWFFTHLTAALLFCIVPNTVLSLFLALVLKSYWYLAFLLLGISVMQFTAFLGMAVFAVMCAGNKVGMAAIYGALHGWPLLIYGIISLFFHPVTYGLRADEDLFQNLSPLDSIMESDYIKTNTYYNFRVLTVYEGIDGENVLVVAVLALFGLLLLGAALLLYRRRKLESAGDFAAIRPVAVVFQALACMMAGCMLMGISESYVIGFIGIILGFFAGKMLLQRKVNVFQKKSFAACGIILVSAAALIFTAKLDPLRLTWKVPEVQQVKSAQIRNESGYIHTDLKADTPEEIELVLQMHQKLVVERPEASLYNNITFEYTLQNGKTMRRYYPVRIDELDQNAMEAYFSRWQKVFNTEEWEAFCNNVTYVRIGENFTDRGFYITEVDREYYETYVPLNAESRGKAMQLLEAMKAECGKVRPKLSSQDHNSKDCYWVTIESTVHGESVYCDLIVPVDCAESATLIKTLLDSYCGEATGEKQLVKYVYG